MTNREHLTILPPKDQKKISKQKLRDLTPRKCLDRRCLDGIGCYPGPPKCLTAYNAWLDMEYCEYDKIWEVIK